jgi:hypothetical protein
MAEKIDVDGFIGTGANLRELVAQRIRLSIAQGSEPSPPAALTAATSSKSIAPAIGASTIGYSMPKSLVNRALGHICKSPQHGSAAPGLARELRA